jgi:transposase InsO family protein
VNPSEGSSGDELLPWELFDALLQAKVLVARWRRHYDAVRPHSSVGPRQPVPEALLPGTRASSLRPWLGSCLDLPA